MPPWSLLGCGWLLGLGGVGGLQHAGVVLVGVRFGAHGRLRSWDRFYVPVPFSRVRMRCELITNDQLADRDAAAARILARLKPFVIREVDGVKVAIIGLTTPGIPNWSRPRLIPGITVEDSVTTLKTVVPAVRKAGDA